MSPVKSLVAAATLIFAIGIGSAHATTINVATFEWTADPVCSVDPLDFGCFSTYSLELLWAGGPLPVPSLTDGQVDTSVGTLLLLQLDPFPGTSFDQISEPGLPTFATVSFNFVFDLAPVTLSATLTDPGIASLTFDVPDAPAAPPAPEPTFLTLFGTAAALAAMQRRRAARRRLCRPRTTTTSEP